jgi:hypothetical protein
MHAVNYLLFRLINGSRIIINLTDFIINFKGIPVLATNTKVLRPSIYSEQVIDFGIHSNVTGKVIRTGSN